MTEPRKTPLDIDEIVDHSLVQEAERGDVIRFYLELVPISILVIALVFKYFERSFWVELMIVGGLLSAFIYLFFSWYMFKVKEYKKLELALSILSGLVFPLGLLGLVGQIQSWAWANDMIDMGLYGALGLCFFSLGLFVFHLRDERASKFYRNLLARLLIFSGILLQMSHIF